MTDILNNILSSLIENEKEKRSHKRRLSNKNLYYSHSSIRLVNLDPILSDKYLLEEMSQYGQILRIKRENSGTSAIITFKFIFDTIKILQTGLFLHTKKKFRPSLERCEDQKVEGVYFD